MSEKMTIVESNIRPPDVAEPGAGPGTLLHKFVKNDSWRGALTNDIKGENLPRLGSPWIYEKEVLVSPGDRRTGASSLQIMRGVAERGYFLFPISDDA
ncbi:MAG: hypothetical protein ACXW2T_05630 [Allosphingosinicella sp.]